MLQSCKEGKALEIITTISYEDAGADRTQGLMPGLGMRCRGWNACCIRVIMAGIWYEQREFL